MQRHYYAACNGGDVVGAITILIATTILLLVGCLGVFVDVARYATEGSENPLAVNRAAERDFPATKAGKPCDC